eukprot:tig00021428_g21155.t1
MHRLQPQGPAVALRLRTALRGQPVVGSTILPRATSTSGQQRPLKLEIRADAVSSPAREGKKDATFEVPESARGAVFVCSRATCHQQSSETVLAWFRDLVPDDIHVAPGGCLAHCGSGPNVVVVGAGGQKLVVGCDSSAKMRAALKETCRLAVSDDLVELIREKMRGGKLWAEGKPEEAAAAFTRGLELAQRAEAAGDGAAGRLRGALLCNRSAARRRRGTCRGPRRRRRRRHVRKGDALLAAGDGAGARGAYEAARGAAGGDAEVEAYLDAALANL